MAKVFKFHRFGTLWEYNGIPVYVGSKCITRNWLVWWWPINWLMTLLLSPYLIYLAIRKPK